MAGSSPCLPVNSSSASRISKAERDFLGLDTSHVDVIHEQRESEFSSEPVHVLHPWRQVTWNDDISAFEVCFEAHDIMQRELPREEVAQEVQASLAQRPAEKRVHSEQAAQIHIVFGERRPTP